MMKKVNRFAEGIVIIFGGLISLILFLEKLFYSYNSAQDKYCVNLGNAFGGLVLYICAFFLLCATMSKIKTKQKYIAVNVGITLLFEVIFCCSLIVGSRIYFSSDVHAVYSLAVSFLNNDYSAIVSKGSYLAIFPQQYGIIFIFETLMRMCGTTNGILLQLMNMGLIIVGTLCSYGIVCQMHPHKYVITAYTLLQISFFPFYLYVATAYGDLPGICLTITSVYLVLKAFERGKYQMLWEVLATVVIVIACLFKKNVLVCVIAIGLVSVVMLFRSFDARNGIWVLITIFFAFTSLPFIQKTYEIRAGQESGPGIPMVTYISLSMQEGLGAPGAWSGYHTDLFVGNDYDYESTSKQAKEDIKELVENFIANPKYMYDFYKTKVAYQWTEGTFSGVGSGIESSFGEVRSRWIQSITSGKANVILVSNGNWHQCVVYLLFFLFMTFSIKDFIQKKEMGHEKMMLLTIVIGGFLFELIWESSSRYVMMYYSMMLLLAPNAVARVCENIKETSSYYIKTIQ